jgi:hypothetical protein
MCLVRKMSAARVRADICTVDGRFLLMEGKDNGKRS